MFQLTRLDEVEPIALADVRFYPLSSPSRGGSELAVWQLHVDPGPVGTPHTIDREEVFVCLEGELLITVDDEQVRLSVGDSLAVPGGSRLSAGGGADGAVALVSTRAGLSAVMDDGTVMHPPWAS